MYEAENNIERNKMTEKANIRTKTTNISTTIKMNEMETATSDQDATDRLIDCFVARGSPVVLHTPHSRFIVCLVRNRVIVDAKTMVWGYIICTFGSNRCVKTCACGGIKE